MAKRWIIPISICVILLLFIIVNQYVLQSIPKTEDTEISYEAQFVENLISKELHIAVFQGGYGPSYWKEIVSLFEEKYAGVSVQLTISPRIGDVIRPQIVAGNPPDFLVISDTQQSGIVTSLIQERGLLDISDVFEHQALDSNMTLKEKLLPGILNSSRFSPYQDGKVYLAPFNVSPMGLVYNKTLFQEKGWELPVTWDDFFALAEELEKRENYYTDQSGKRHKRALFTYPGIYPEYLEEILYPAIANIAGVNALKRLYNYEPGSFHTAEVKQVLDIIAKIGNEGYLMDGTLDLNHTQSQQAMMEGKALFIVNGTWIENEMLEASREEDFSFGMIPAPVLDERNERYILSSYEQFSIPLKAKNPELAKEFLRFLYTDQSVQLFAKKSNGIYALKDARDIAQPYLSSGVYEMLSSYELATPIMLEWAAIPKNVDVDIWYNLYKRSVSPVMKGQLTTEEWMQRIEELFEIIHTP